MAWKGVLLSLLSLIIAGAAWADVAFLNLAQRQELYQDITSEISRLDAEGVARRDLVKKTPWKSFSQSLESSFEQATNWDELRAAFKNLSLGFVNAHSQFSFYLGKSSIVAAGTMNRAIGYEYPKFQLFDIQTGLEIKAINGVGEVLRPHTRLSKVKLRSR